MNTLEFPRHLEPYSNTWWSGCDPRGQNTIVQTEKSITDGVLTIFDGWQDNGGADSHRLHWATESLKRDLLESTLIGFDSKNPSVEHKMHNGDYWLKQNGLSLGSIVWVEDDRSPKSHSITIHINGEEKMTENPDLADSRIEMEPMPRDGLFPNKEWTDRALVCADFLSWRILKYIEAASEHDDYLEHFLQERYTSLARIITANGMRLERTDGIAENKIKNRRAPYRGVTLDLHDGRRLVHFREAASKDKHLPYGTDKDQTYFRDYNRPKLDGVEDIDKEIIEPLELLFRMGGMTGLVSDLEAQSR